MWSIICLCLDDVVRGIWDVTGPARLVRQDVVLRLAPHELNTRAVDSIIQERAWKEATGETAGTTTGTGIQEQEQEQEQEQGQGQAGAP
jgi:hypothetical protein